MAPGLSNLFPLQREEIEISKSGAILSSSKQRIGTVGGQRGGGVIGLGEHDRLCIKINADNLSGQQIKAINNHRAWILSFSSS